MRVPVNLPGARDGRLLRMVVQPGDEALALGAGFGSDLSGRLVAVAGGGVRVSSAGQQALGGPPLPAVAGCPRVTIPE
jgi:hypothetical protein